MSPQGEGHLFEKWEDQTDLVAPSGNLELIPGSPPEDWSLNQLGQPLWLLGDQRSQLTAAWAVIVPPPPPSASALPRELVAARGLDRADQGLPPWGESLAPDERSNLLTIGPASMPVIPWHTGRPIRRGNPSIAWTARETAGCAAWLADIRRWNVREIGAALFPAEAVVVPGKPPYDFDSHRQKVRRYIGMGRRVLCDQGVWPWSVGALDEYGEPTDDDLIEETGSLPAGWWQDDYVLSHIHLWRVLAEHLAAGQLESIKESLATDDFPMPW